MTRRRFSRLAAVSVALVFSASALNAQPEFRSDVHREFDEDGNMIHYDSCWSWHHSGPSSSFDSLYREFMEHHSFTFDFPPGLFPDSSLDFSSFFSFPDPARDFNPFFGFSDWGMDLDHFFGLPDSSMAFDHFFGRSDSAMNLDEFGGNFPFPDFERFYEEQIEWMKEFFREYSFPGDSIPHFSPRWQQFPGGPPEHPPGNQKKSVRTIDI